ncbi:MAG: hypothetical protein H6696_14900 [Deferribacteres bacterium]|nr:hypothetical protein [candidate division KSB1 bacterium]MCB9503216.1 hypothetical protein [Deferribacteres bacterium]
MLNSFEQYSKLAELLVYPGPDFKEQVKEVTLWLDQRYPEPAAHLHKFSDFVANATQIELEELYTRSFDVQAATTLDLGYVLFGDDYKRGAVLVGLNSEHKEAGIDCGGELADHLPNILRLLHKMQKPEIRAELVEKIIAPAIKKIINEFQPQKIEAKEAVYKKHHKTIIEKSQKYSTIYQQPLKTVYDVLKHDFDFQEYEMPAKGADFIKSVGSEMKIEAEHNSQERQNNGCT